MPPTGEPSCTTNRWIYGRRIDMLMAWSWLPFFAATVYFSLQRSSFGDAAVISILGWVLLVSLLHQPLTLLLVYGDRSQFTQRRRLFVLTPLIAVPLLILALTANLWVIIPIAAVWNMFHIQQQRYGMLRIYARKSRYGSVALDRALTYVPFVTVLIVVAALPSTLEQLARFGRTLGDNNVQAIQGILDVRSFLVWLLVPLGASTVATLGAYVAQEWRVSRSTSVLRAAARPNPAKWNYLTAGLALMAALVVSPVAGLVSYIASHALEYVIVVHRTLVARYAAGTGNDAGPLAVLARTPLRRALLLLGFFVLVAVLNLQLQGILPAQVYLIIVYSIGLMHFVYDAHIWKSRRPSVAADFGIVAVAEVASAPNSRAAI